MEKPPIIGNITGKIRGASSNEDENDLTEGQADVLEQFRIPLNVEVPETILTANEAKMVRFSYSKPKGFAPRQVEEFYAQVLDSLQFYLKALDSRNKHVHKLATEVDKYKTDYQNAKYNLELFQGIGKQAVVNEDGEYVSESQIDDKERELLQKDEEIQTLRDQLLMARKEKDLAEERARSIAAAPVPSLPVVAGGLSDAEKDELEAFRENQTALDKWEQEIIEEYSKLEATVESLKASSGGNEASSETIEQLRNEVSELSTDVARLAGEIAERDEMLAERDESVAEMTKRIDKAKVVVEELHERIESAESRASELEGELAAARADSQGSEDQAKRVAILAGEVEALKDGLKSTQDELVEAIDVANDIEAERVRLETELAELRANGQPGENEPDEVASLQEHIASLDEYIDTLEKHVKIVEEDQSVCKQMIETLRTEIQDKEQRILELQEKASGLGGQSIPGYILPPGVRPEDLIG